MVARESGTYGYSAFQSGQRNGVPSPQSLAAEEIGATRMLHLREWTWVNRQEKIHQMCLGTYLNNLAKAG